MGQEEFASQKLFLNNQREHWEITFSKRPDMFGDSPSDPARRAHEIFKNAGVVKVLDLGAGQGRDTIFFGQNEFEVWALDYSEVAVRAIIQKARALGLSGIKGLTHDVREPLPFEDGFFDGCYSHMLYCMALTTAELEFLSEEIRRVLRPGGINVYTVRTTKDPDYRAGVHRGENMYEVGGFIVHFFSVEKVEHLTKGWEILEIEEFEEGKLPRKLFRVTLKKKS